MVASMGLRKYPGNPISPYEDTPGWDYDAVYKSFAICGGDRWFLCHNGRRQEFEQVGLAIHEDAHLWLPG